MENLITFGTLTRGGALINIRLIRQCDIKKCLFYILAPEHYREDGTCKCTNKDHRRMMIRDWGYSRMDFKNILLVD